MELLVAAGAAVTTSGFLFGVDAAKTAMADRKEEPVEDRDAASSDISGCENESNVNQSNEVPYSARYATDDQPMQFQLRHSQPSPGKSTETNSTMAEDGTYQDLACGKCNAKCPGSMLICINNIGYQKSRRDANCRDGYSALCPKHKDQVGYSSVYWEEAKLEIPEAMVSEPAGRDLATSMSMAFAAMKEKTVSTFTSEKKFKAKKEKEDSQAKAVMPEWLDAEVEAQQMQSARRTYDRSNGKERLLMGNMSTIAVHRSTMNGKPEARSTPPTSSRSTTSTDLMTFFAFR